MDKALVSLTFDDGLRCQFERAVPLLDHYGFPATFFLVANTDPIFNDGCAENQKHKWRKIDWSARDIRLLKSMLKRGHEIGSHTVSHKRPLIQAEPMSEASASRNLIETWMGVEIPSFCYPFYETIQDLKEPAIRAGYQQARTGHENAYYASPDSVDWFAVDCRQITTGENVSGWVKPGCWHVLTFHGIGNEQDGWEPITELEFARQMAELEKLRRSGAVEVLTFQDAANRLRQEKEPRG
ncbi:MAG TPA: polysaccharide deacetylase family protein [Terriglobales bacterium]|nr:polysaccharide deacetylase family protein [Terriglobales bacterium]